MDNYYDSISDGYEELHRAEQQKKMEIITRLIHPKNEETLLDVGCGTGLTTEPWDCIRTGADPARKLLEKARQKDKITYVLAPAEELPFDDDHFDYVTSVTAIQNFNDIKKGLEEIRRVGKKTFILTFLKKSSKAGMIESTINEMFIIDKMIDEEKDTIILCHK